MKTQSVDLLYVVDLAGTLLFAIEGATAAISGNLDLLGIMVLAFATALGGGIIRDVFIGSIPPNALRDWRYSAVAFVGAGVVFFLYHFVQAIPANVIMVLDAAGLSLFAIAGAQKVMLFEMPPFAVLLGGITGVGGGTIRDVLLARIPIVLRAEVYATAALAGAAVMVICRRLNLPAALSAALGGAVCFLLRVVSVWLHWNLPRAG